MDIVKKSKMVDYITNIKNRNKGKQVILKFPNNYGASVILNPYSYGVELAVLYNDSICYDTPITDDVIGYIKSEEELIEILENIKNL